MTIINPFYLEADGHVIGTYADTIQVIRGLRVMPGKRRRPLHAASRHGTIPVTHLYRDENRLSIQITIKPWNADGEVDHPDGAIGHLQENLDSLFAIFDKSTPIDLHQWIPFRGDEGSGGPDLELQAWAIVDKVVTVEGDSGEWRMLVELILQWPWWHELPVITETSVGGLLDLETGGTAPVADMIFTFSGDGVLTWDDGSATEQGPSILEIAGSTGPVVVDVGRRLVTQAGAPARGLLRLGEGTPAHWMEWPAQSSINMTTTVGVSVSFYNARQ